MCVCIKMIKVYQKMCAIMYNCCPLFGNTYTKISGDVDEL